MEVLLGKRLKELREEKGMSQKQLAEKLGINAVTYLHYEKAQREPPLTILIQFAEFYNVTTDYLLGIKEY